MPHIARMVCTGMVILLNGLPVAMADTLISQHPNAVDGLYADPDCNACQGGQQSIAANFVLMDAADVATIRLWGGYVPAGVPITPDDFSYAIYPDNAGLPDAAPLPGCQQTGLRSSRINTGDIVFGVPRYAYVLTPATPCRLPEAGIYWIEIFNNTASSTESFFWETGDIDPDNGFPGSALSSTAPGTNWNLASDDLAIELFDDAAYCSPAPRLGCAIMPNARLRADTVKKKLVFLTKGNIPDLGDPTTDDGQATCIYDKHQQLIADLSVPAGGLNRHRKPYWEVSRFHVRFRDINQRNNGVRNITYKVGKRLKAKAREQDLVFERPFEFPVTVQYRSRNGQCLEATFQFNDSTKTNGEIKARFP